MILIDKLKEMISKRKEELAAREEMPDDMTRDRYLRSLRRERRVQMEEVEKQQLKQQIEEFKRQKNRTYLWGLSREPSQNIMNESPSRKKIKRQSGFFNKGNI